MTFSPIKLIFYRVVVKIVIEIIINFIFYSSFNTKTLLYVPS